jgi:hypothetical protein
VQSTFAAVTAVRIRSDAIVELFGQGDMVSSQALTDFKTCVAVSFAPFALALTGGSGKRVRLYCL